MFDLIGNLSLKETLEHSSQVAPEAAPKFDSDVISINVNLDVSRGHMRHHPAIVEALHSKFKTRLNQNRVNVYFSLA